MHELSIAISLLDVAAEEAMRQDGGRVVAIHLRLGVLSGVVKEALFSAFDTARDATELRGCRLIIEEVPLTIDCPTCHQRQPAKSIQEMCCKICGTPSMNVVTGRELEISAMEMADEQ